MHELVNTFKNEKLCIVRYVLMKMYQTTWIWQMNDDDISLNIINKFSYKGSSKIGLVPKTKSFKSTDH